MRRVPGTLISRLPRELQEELGKYRCSYDIRTVVDGYGRVYFTLEFKGSWNPQILAFESGELARKRVEIVRLLEGILQGTPAELLVGSSTRAIYDPSIDALRIPCTWNAAYCAVFPICPHLIEELKKLIMLNPSKEAEDYWTMKPE